MDLQLFLAINVIALTALAASMAVMHRPPGFAVWTGVNVAVAAVAGAALAKAPDHAGLIALAAFIPLVVVPVVLSQLSQRQSNRGRYAQAARLAGLAAVFHPTQRSRLNAALARAHALSEELGDNAPLRDLMRRVAPDQRPIIEGMIARSDGRWGDIVEIVRRGGGNRRDLALLEIRALGEIGRYDDMADRFERAKSSLVGNELVFAQLFVLAFAGRRAAVERLLDVVKALDDEAKAYWRALAALRSPDGHGHDDGRVALGRLAVQAMRATTRHAAERHLAGEARVGGVPLTPASEAIVAATETRVYRFVDMTSSRSLRTPLTLALIALNGLAFAAEVASGGSERTDVLVDLGALFPPLVLGDGQWWRLLSSSFLHFGPVHLGANMLMLYLLGGIIERGLGWRALITGYVIGGIGSAAFVLWLMQARLIAYAVLVGASGAAMALFGMLVARSVSDWRRSRDVLDRRRVVSLAIVMAVQIVIDLGVPQVSLAAHLSGFAIGLLLGFLPWRRARA